MLLCTYRDTHFFFTVPSPHLNPSLFLSLASPLSHPHTPTQTHTKRWPWPQRSLAKQSMIMGCVFVSFSGSTRRQSSAASDKHTLTHTHLHLCTYTLTNTKGNLCDCSFFFPHRLWTARVKNTNADFNASFTLSFTDEGMRSWREVTGWHQWKQKTRDQSSDCIWVEQRLLRKHYSTNYRTKWLQPQPLWKTICVTNMGFPSVSSNLFSSCSVISHVLEHSLEYL